MGEPLGEAAVEGFVVDPSLLEEDYSRLSQQGPLIGYVVKLIQLDYDAPIAHKLDVALADIQGYMGYMTAELANAYRQEEPDESTTREAAAAVWGIIHRSAQNDAGLPGLALEFYQRLDAELAARYDVDKRVNPHRHEEPIVAAFYSEFWQHLDMPQPGDRRGGFNV